MKEVQKKMKGVASWAQVMPAKQAENLRINCPYCEKVKYDWIINGRSSGLTKTGTTYSCNTCLWRALSKVRWN